MESLFSLSLSHSHPLYQGKFLVRERIFYIATPAGPKLAKKSPAREIRAGLIGGVGFWLEHFPAVGKMGVNPSESRCRKTETRKPP